MKLQDLFNAKNLIIQIILGEKTIEFPTKVIERDSESIFVAPYLYKATPLELNINMKSDVICSIFGDDPETGNRISWRKIELNTVLRKEQTLYQLKTSAYNSNASIDERRDEVRIQITKEATMMDSVAQRVIPIRVHDVSDSGISFYAPTSYQPETNSFLISFNDMVNDQDFELNVKCKVVRTKNLAGTVFYGCRIAEDNDEYLMYVCLIRLLKNTGDYRHDQRRTGSD